MSYQWPGLCSDVDGMCDNVMTDITGGCDVPGKTVTRRKRRHVGASHTHPTTDEKLHVVVSVASIL